MSEQPAPDSAAVRFTQWSLLGLGTVWMGSIFLWVGHLVRNSVHLGDVPSASIGISLVAIPVFMTLLTILHFLFWGLLRDKDRR